MGIFGDVYLDVLPDIYLGDPYVKSILSDHFTKAEVLVEPDAINTNHPTIAYELISPLGELLSRKTFEVKGSFSIPVERPQLWWPMDYGDHALYTLKLNLLADSKIVDTKEMKFGIWDIQMELKDDKTGDPRFGFRINGKMIFMHGACWAPLEGFTHIWNPKRAERLIDLMKLGHLNFLRVWGEGEIPGQSLFESCDREGIVVWMEFMTSAPLNHPVNDAAFRANISAEIADEIKRFRNHPSIAIWCGGNEHYLKYPSKEGDNSQPFGRELFQQIMPEMVAKYDSQRHFHPSSPWGGEDRPNGNYPLEGDFHDYSTIRFQPQSTVPLFTIEACMVSPYSLHNLKRFMSDEEIWPAGFRFVIDQPGKKAWPSGWEKHTISSSWEKIGRIQDYCDIQNAEDACRVFGTAHGEYLKDRYGLQVRATLPFNTSVQGSGLLPQGIQIMFNGDDPLMFAIVAPMRGNGLVLEENFNFMTKYFKINKTPNQLVRYRITVGAVAYGGILIDSELC